MKNTVKNIILLATMFLSFASCNGPKEMSTEQAPRHFIIGSGGGFAGRYDIYRVNDDGRIEKQEGFSENYSLVKTIPLDSARSYFLSLDKLEIENLEFNFPGNMSYFIEVGDGPEPHRIKWGAQGHPIRKDIEAFFQRTNSMIRTEHK